MDCGCALACPIGPARTHYGIASPLICSPVAATSGQFRSSWDTHHCRRRSATPRSILPGSPRSIVPPTRGRGNPLPERLLTVLVYDFMLMKAEGGSRGVLVRILFI